jgi:NTE family protein
MLEAQHSDLLRGLTASELEMVLSRIERRHYAAGQTILQRGEAGDSLYVIDTGLVCVTIPGRDGVESVVAQLGPGQIFGEMSILTGRPRSAEVRALVATDVSVLPVADFFEVAGRSPTILLNIGRVLAGRLALMSRADTHREQRALVVLVGPTQPLVGSLLATNLTVALAATSRRRSTLLDLPADRAARLPGREWAPDLDQIRVGGDAFLHASAISLGAVSIHAADLPDARAVLEVGGVEATIRAISQVARASEFVVVNLTGPPSPLAERVVSLASRVYVLASTGLLGSKELQSQIQRYRKLLASTATLGLILLARDGTVGETVRQQVQSLYGLPDCLTLGGQADLLREADQVEAPLVLRAPALATSRSLSRLAREVAGLRVGLALGSGAARGVAHVGVVAALHRLRVPIDVVTGTSIGALVGAGIAMGMDLGQIEETMSRLVDLWQAALRPNMPRFSVFSPRGLDRIVHQLAGDLRIDELSLPYGAVATDLVTGRPVNIFQGSVAQAIRASISIPMVFPPVFAGDYVLVDGFLTNPVPTIFARQLGADVVIASNLARPTAESDLAPIELGEPITNAPARKMSPPNIIETYMRCSDIVMSGRGEHDCLSADLTIRPRLSQLSWHEFQKGGAPMLAGEQAVDEQVATLRELLPWLRPGA